MPNGLLLDQIGDLQYVNGIRQRGEITEQNQMLLLLSAKGDFKESPTVGVGIAGYLKDDDVTGLLGEIKKEFQRDGMNVKKISLTGSQLVIIAPYD